MIDAESLGTLRVARTAADFLTHLSAEPSSTPQAWDLTDKHRVLWLLPTKSLRDVLSSVGKSQGRGGAKGSSKGGRQVLDIADNARASQLWQAGSFALCDVCPTIQYWKVATVICAARPPKSLQVKFFALLLSGLGTNSTTMSVCGGQCYNQASGSWATYF